MTRKEKIKDLILMRRGFFSLDQIVAETHFPRPLVREVLDQLESEGVVSKSVRPSWVYRINLAEEGEKIALNRIWTAIRYKGDFTLHDLIILAGVKRETARSFCKALRKGGFIRPNKPTGRGVFWTLIKDPGPRRPYVGDQGRRHLRAGAVISHQRR
jgi:DNA-binding IclR family transcriptional regulator